LPPKENILAFLARVKPQSQTLLDYCLKFIRIFDNPSDFHSLTNLFAVTKVIGANFFGNTDALKTLLAGRSLEQLSDTLIGLVYEIYPHSKETKDLYKIIYKTKMRLSQSTYYEIVTKLFSAKQVFESVLKLLKDNENEKLNQYYSQEIFRLLLKRIEVDKKLQKLCMKHLKNPCSTSEKIVIAKLISQSNSLSKDFNKWRMEELEKEMNKKFLEAGFDLSSGSSITLAQCLLFPNN
jgi:hypothetical protein